MCNWKLEAAFACSGGITAGADTTRLPEGALAFGGQAARPINNRCRG